MNRQSLKLLIVDDEASTRLLMSQVFNHAGHTVRAAEDGFAALSLIREETPDVVLSDLNMPGMSGFELLSVVRRRFPAIRAVAMSGAFSGDTVQPGVAADGFYEKASGINSLFEVMQSVIEQERISPESQRRPVPFWIQTELDPPSGENHVTISCPECLRTFPLIAGEAVGNVNIYQTPCVHCETVIHFAIVEPTNAASPQSFQRKSIRVTPLKLAIQ